MARMEIDDVLWPCVLATWLSVAGYPLQADEWVDHAATNIHLDAVMGLPVSRVPGWARA